MILTETSSTVKTTVRYDRSARTWQAINGVTTPTGNGPDGKRAALLLALAHDHPELHQTVMANAKREMFSPQAVDRLIRAAQLIVGGNVYQDAVQSQTNPDQFYTVTFDGMPARYSCDCPDENENCKHIRAVDIAWRLGLELASRPHATDDLTDDTNIPF